MENEKMSGSAAYAYYKKKLSIFSAVPDLSRSINIAYHVSFSKSY